jgi:hypothetical protein
MCCSASNCLCVFYCCFCCWFLVLMHCGQTECMGLFLFSICWGLLCALRCDQFWRRFHELLRRMYIVQQLGKYSVDISSIWSMVWFSSRISLRIFCLDDLSIGYGGVLRSSTTTVLECIYVFRSFRVCLMKLSVLTLGAYRLIIVISFWCISPFISIECPSLSHLTNVRLKTTLYEISIVLMPVFRDHWLGRSSSSLSLSASACFWLWGGSPEGSRLWVFLFNPV